ncbi:MAG: hypothetical protein PHE36_09220 [Novosphingobium sp.]|nr:hypothetical protein [Novosphingobium sp.]
MLVRLSDEAAFKQLDREGFCIFEGTYDRAMNGVGTALVEADGAVHGFSCFAPAFQFALGKMRAEVGPRLALMVSRIAPEVPVMR